MFHLTWTFNVIDTCSDTSDGEFYFLSKISAKVEARSITNWPDINYNLPKLRQNCFDEYDDRGKRQFSNRFYASIDYPKYKKGTKYVSLGVIIILQQEMSYKNLTLTTYK